MSAASSDPAVSKSLLWWIRILYGRFLENNCNFCAITRNTEEREY
jgi:hypothetical protein